MRSSSLSGSLLCVLLAVSFLVLAPGLAAKAASLVARVDLSSQRMTVYVNGKRKYSWPVATGKRGWRTPTGHYTPITTYRSYYSKRWRMSLPYSVVISYGGIAIHGTSGPVGRPRSHGCIRLRTANAAKFYRLVKQHGLWNTSVYVKP